MRGASILGLLVILLSVGFAACGYGSATIATPLPQTQSQTQLQMKIKNCGTVQGLRGLEVPVNDNGGAAAENCFWQAFRTCQPATLVYIMGGVDTVLTRTFTIHNNHGKCSITDTRQFQVVPRLPSPAQVFTCAGLTKLSNTLRINTCGKDGNIVLPEA
jgi:hypothetical protein